MNKKLAYVGIDYHMNSLTLAVKIEGERDLFDTIRIKNDKKVIKKFMKKLAKTYTVKACYEASCNGYTFQRKMKTWGYDCEVIAPSLIPKKAGNKRKNDLRDAIDLVTTLVAALENIGCHSASILDPVSAIPGFLIKVIFMLRTSWFSNNPRSRQRCGIPRRGS